MLSTTELTIKSVDNDGTRSTLTNDTSARSSNNSTSNSSNNSSNNSTNNHNNNHNTNDGTNENRISFSTTNRNFEISLNADVTDIVDDNVNSAHSIHSTTLPNYSVMTDDVTVNVNSISTLSSSLPSSSSSSSSSLLSPVQNIIPTTPSTTKNTNNVQNEANTLTLLNASTRMNANANAKTNTNTNTNMNTNSDIMSSSSLSLRYSQICASVTSLFSSNSASTLNEKAFYDNDEDDHHHHHEKIGLTLYDNDDATDTDVDHHHTDDQNEQKDEQKDEQNNISYSHNDLNIHINQNLLETLDLLSNSEHTTTSSVTGMSFGSANNTCTNAELSNLSCHGTNLSRHELDSFLNVGRHLMQQPSTTTNTTTTDSSSSPITTTDTAIGVGAATATTTATDDATSMNNSSSSWYKNLKEDDWDNFSKVAEQVLVAIEPDFDFSTGTDSLCGSDGVNDKGTLAGTFTPMIEPPTLNEKESYMIPPSTSNHVNVLSNSRGHEITSLLFPDEFKCPLCLDLLVGSIILDCGCRQSTYCIPCLEQFQKKKKDSTRTTITPTGKTSGKGCLKKCDSDEEDGFVVIDWNKIHDEKIKCIQVDDKKGKQDRHHSSDPSSCPSCQGSYKHAIPCNTLDIAVLNAVRNINLATHSHTINSSTTGGNNDNISSNEIRSFQAMYYRRVQRWRDEFCRRRKSKLDMKKQLLLSKIISEQEALMEEVKRRREIETAAAKQKCETNEAGEQMPTLLMAALIGINIFIFRKWVI